jgi:small conductance mechanosensitive channel
LQTRIRQISNVLTQPAPDIEILKLDAAVPVLAVRPYCHNDNYWQVYFDTNKIIPETFTDAGYPVPEEHFLFTGLSKATANGN